MRGPTAETRVFVISRAAPRLPPRAPRGGAPPGRAAPGMRPGAAGRGGVSPPCPDVPPSAALWGVLALEKRSPLVSDVCESEGSLIRTFSISRTIWGTGHQLTADDIQQHKILVGRAAHGVALPAPSACKLHDAGHQHVHARPQALAVPRASRVLAPVPRPVVGGPEASGAAQALLALEMMSSHSARLRPLTSPASMATRTFCCAPSALTRASFSARAVLRSAAAAAC